MTVRELKELIDSFDDEELDQEVYILEQPNWPFVYSVDTAEHMTDSYWGDDDDRSRDQQPGLYLAEGTQLGYASSVQCDTFGWR